MWILPPQCHTSLFQLDQFTMRDTNNQHTNQDVQAVPTKPKQRQDKNRSLEDKKKKFNNNRLYAANLKNKKKTKKHPTNQPNTNPQINNRFKRLQNLYSKLKSSGSFSYHLGISLPHSADNSGKNIRTKFAKRYLNQFMPSTNSTKAFQKRAHHNKDQKAADICIFQNSKRRKTGKIPFS